MPRVSAFYPLSAKDRAWDEQFGPQEPWQISAWCLQRHSNEGTESSPPPLSGKEPASTRREAGPCLRPPRQLSCRNVTQALWVAPESESRRVTEEAVLMTGCGGAPVAFQGGKNDIFTGLIWVVDLASPLSECAKPCSLATPATCELHGNTLSQKVSDLLSWSRHEMLTVVKLYELSEATEMYFFLGILPNAFCL